MTPTQPTDRTGFDEFLQSNRSCPLCAGLRLERYRAVAHDSRLGETVGIVECGSCGFGWQYPPARSKTDSVRFFEDAYADRGRTVSGYFDEEWKRRVAAMQMQLISRLRREPCTLLDVGCGAGAFLEEAAKHRWEVMGVDPAYRAADHSRSASGIDIRRGWLHDIPFDRRFDVVTLWDVIEHVDNPLATIAAVRDLVAPQGLIILETGNFRSAERIEAGGTWWCYQVDHRWYWSPDTLERVLRSCGFDGFRYADHVLRPEWRGVSEYAGPSRAQYLRRVLRTPWRAPSLVRDFRMLRDVAVRWPYSGLGIFTIAGQAT